MSGANKKLSKKEYEKENKILKEKLTMALLEKCNIIKISRKALLFYGGASHGSSCAYPEDFCCCGINTANNALQEIRRID